MTDHPFKKPRWGTAGGAAAIRRGGKRGRGRGALRSTRFMDTSNNENIELGNVAGPSNLPIAAPSQLKKLKIIQLEDVEEYPGWKLYFPDELYNESSETAKQIQLFEEHFLFKSDSYQLSMIQKNLRFKLNYHLLLETESFKTGWPSLQTDLASKPEYVLNCAGVAMHKLVTNAGIDLITTQSSTDDYYVPSTLSLDKIHARLVDFPAIPMGSITSENYDTLVTVRGNATRIALPELLRTWQAFECPMCGRKQAIAQKKPKEDTTPATCFGDCRCKREFIPLQSSPFTRLEAFQTIHLCEGVKISGKFEAGIQMVEVLLSNDLVDSFGIGSDITVTGILRVKPQEDRGKSMAMYVEAVSVSS